MTTSCHDLCFHTTFPPATQPCHGTPSGPVRGIIELAGRTGPEAVVLPVSSGGRIDPAAVYFSNTPSAKSRK